MVVWSIGGDLRAQKNSCTKLTSFYFFPPDLNVILTAQNQRDSPHLVLLSFHKEGDVLGACSTPDPAANPEQRGSRKQTFPQCSRAWLPALLRRWSCTGEEPSAVKHTDTHQNKMFLVLHQGLKEPCSIHRTRTIKPTPSQSILKIKELKNLHHQHSLNMPFSGFSLCYKLANAAVTVVLKQISR